MFFMCSMSVISSFTFSISLSSFLFSRSLVAVRVTDRLSYLFFQTSTSFFFWLMSLASRSFSLRSWSLCLTMSSVLSSSSLTFLLLALRMLISSTKLLFSLSSDRISSSRDSGVVPPVALPPPTPRYGLVLDLFILNNDNIITVNHIHLYFICPKNINIS